MGDAHAGAAALARQWRGGFCEGVHHGHAVIIDERGEILSSLGDPAAVVLPRSALKPAQAAAALDAGADLSGAHLALASASHSGEPAHLALVSEVLAWAGCTEADLRCPPDLPYGTAEADRWRREGRPPRPLAMNCSGKHAAMLLASRRQGWPLGTYLDIGHPVAHRVRAMVAAAGGRIAGVTVDGCGAPLFALPLIDLARMYSRAVTSDPGHPSLGPLRQVADAVRAHPAIVGGHQRDVTALMTAVPGLLTKEGAAGVHAGALPDGRAFACTVLSGSMAVRIPVVLAMLDALGVDVPEDAQSGLLRRPRVLGGGRPVGFLVAETHRPRR